MKFSALLALCGPFVLHSFAQGTRPADGGIIPAASGSSPTCTLGLTYCGQTLLNKGWSEALIIGIADQFPRGNQFVRDNFRRALIKCGASYRLSEATPGLTYLELCDNVCVDGGAAKSDYCAQNGEYQKCTPGLKYCGRTLQYMGYTSGRILNDLSRASGGVRQWPSVSYIQQMENWVLECRPDGLWYESQCGWPSIYSCVDAGPGKSDYCPSG